MNRLVLVDGHAILYRAYHALPTSLTTSTGQIVNAVYGFTSMLLRVIVELKPTHCAIVFDTPEPTFRNKLYKDYQIQRPKADPEFIAQIDIVKRVVGEMRIPLFACPGFEADDVIGTLAKQAENAMEVVIVTSDRDMLQLVVDEKIKLYMPVVGLSQSRLYGEKEVEQRMNVKPAQIVDYKALVGDASDNYPGVSGIGPKTAERLLKEWGTLENMYTHILDIDGRIAQKLDKEKKLAFLSKELATIVTNAPVTFEAQTCILPDFDKPNVHHLLEELAFRSLIPRLASNNKKQITDDKQQRTEEIDHHQTTLF